VDGVSANADGGAVGDSHLATGKFDRQVDFNFNVKHMTTHPASTGRARVTLRHLAELASVSTQAVSLALRNHPSIGRSTRDRIRALALREGYAPDPHLVKLMHHLRGRKTPKATASVCALTTRPPNLKEKFCDLLLEGAREGARAAGFAFDIMYIDSAESRRRLQRQLRQRGVEGLLLLPMARLEALDELLDWREFSVVSATLSVARPHFDRVVADHFLNNFSICERLQRDGFRRPGLVIHAQHDQRCGHSISAACAWHGIYGKVEPLKAHVCDKLEASALRRWLTKERPDVVLAEQDALAHLLRAAGGMLAGLPIISCSARPLDDGTFPFSGNYDRPDEIGATAVERLAHKIATGQRGIPEQPHTTLVRGKWIEGNDRPVAAPVAGTGVKRVRTGRGVSR